MDTLAIQVGATTVLARCGESNVLPAVAGSEGWGSKVARLVAFSLHGLSEQSRRRVIAFLCQPDDRKSDCGSDAYIRQPKSVRLADHSTHRVFLNEQRSANTISSAQFVIELIVVNAGIEES